MTARERYPAAFSLRERYAISLRRRRSLAIIVAVVGLLLTAWMVGPALLSSSLDFFAPIDPRGVFDGG